MGHGRSVLAGLVAGVVAGFLVELLRPRGTHPAAPAHPDAPWQDEASREPAGSVPVPVPVPGSHRRDGSDDTTRAPD